MNPATILAEIWAVMGPKVRSWLLTVLGVFVVCALLMLTWFYITSGLMYKQLGLLPTKEEFTEQTESIKDAMATTSDVQEVAGALYAYQDSLGRLRTHFDTTLITPGITAIIDLQKRMRMLERGQVETRLAVEEQKQQGSQNTDALIHQMSMQSNAEEREREWREAQEKERVRRDRVLLEAIAKKVKVNVKEF